MKLDAARRLGNSDGIGSACHIASEYPRAGPPRPCFMASVVTPTRSHAVTPTRSLRLPTVTVPVTRRGGARSDSETGLGWRQAIPSRSVNLNVKVNSESDGALLSEILRNRDAERSFPSSRFSGRLGVLFQVREFSRRPLRKVNSFRKLVFNHDITSTYSRSQTCQCVPVPRQCWPGGTQRPRRR